jgi:CubicO group peptidase (beta-lactamase class C family)
MTLPSHRLILCLFALLLVGQAVGAAPDEELLGKSRGYPVGSASNWFIDQGVRVGSFTHLAEIPGVQNGQVHELPPSARPLPLPRAAQEPAYHWGVGQERGLTVDDYLARQRIMGLIIVKDGVVQLERYQYGRTAQDRFVSQSMAKSITALGVGMALQEGRIHSLDDRADQYAPALQGTLYGETSVRNLLRMASGARFVEDYSGHDDSARFAVASSRGGIEAAARVITEREVPQGQRFNYASAETHVLGAVLRGAVGASLSDYLAPRLWQAVGAETSALWRTDRTGLELAAGYFNATLRDYARLGVVLANDGVRPDDPEQRPIVNRDFLLDATDARRVAPPFRPGTATPYYGYGYKFWLFPGTQRRFALLGVYGQMILVDPQLKLVMVQTAANATAKAGQTTLGREADALWRGLVKHYGAPW